MNRIFAASRAWFRKALKTHEKIDATVGGPRISLPMNIADEPRETRAGFDPKDGSPFYEMNPKRLWGYYFGYGGTYEFRYDMLYADLLAFSQNGLHPIVENFVKIEDVKVSFSSVKYRLPPKLAKHGEQAIAFFKKLKKINYDPQIDAWENNTTFRLARLDAGGRFFCQPVTYFDQIGTNITLDWNSGLLPDKAVSIRSGVERPIAGKLPGFEHSILANNFGSAIMFFDRELRRTFVRVRSAEMGSIAHRALHCTVSGVLELRPDTTAGEHDFDFFLYGTHLEIKMETDLNEDQYLLFPVAFARELPRGGKPQLFFVAVCLVSDEEFERSCQNAIEKNEYITNTDNTFFDKSGKKQISMPEAFTYEGYACHWLAEEFLSANEVQVRLMIAAALKQI